MALQIRWTENALEDYRHVVEYLIQEWSVGIAKDFVEIVEKRIDTLSVFPNIGIPSIKEPGIRSIILTKHNRLYYRVSTKFIEILDIFDTRQDPAKNKYD
jgi:plasmid stabilization system protein ParE